MQGGAASLAENMLLDAEAVMADLHFLSGDGVEVDEDDDDEDEECLSDEERDDADDARERKKASKVTMKSLQPQFSRECVVVLDTKMKDIPSGDLIVSG